MPFIAPFKPRPKPSCASLHHMPNNWKRAPMRYRPGWFETRCKICNGFIGWNVEERVPGKRKKKKNKPVGKLLSRHGGQDG